MSDSILPPPVRIGDAQIIHMQAMEIFRLSLLNGILEEERLKLTADRDHYQRAFLLLSKTRKQDCPYCVWHKDLGKSDERTAR